MTDEERAELIYAYLENSPYIEIRQKDDLLVVLKVAVSAIDWTDSLSGADATIYDSIADWINYTRLGVCRLWKRLKFLKLSPKQ